MPKKLIPLLLVAITILLAGLLVLITRQANPPVIVSRTDPPKINFEKEIHELGTVTEGAEIAYTFKIHNIGGEPLIIKNVTTSCGCTLLNLKNKIIEPGKTGDIDVIMDTSMKQGYVKKAIDIFSNDPNQPKATLYIAANVIPAISQSESSKLNQTDLSSSHNPTREDSPPAQPADVHADLNDRTKKAKIFTGQCATCHVSKGKGKLGGDLYQADCAMCHGSNAEGAAGPALVPGDYQNPEYFKRIQETTRYGSKSHASMPGFLEEAGGPLTSDEINSIIEYLQNQSEQGKTEQSNPSGPTE